MSSIEIPTEEVPAPTEAPRKIKIIRRVPLEGQSWEQIISTYTPPTWSQVFEKTALERKTIASVIVAKDLPRYKEFFPAKENIYKAFDLTPLPSVRVVIIGQDPYPQRAKSGLPKAQGLAFSIAKDDRDIPGSLKNIYKELQNEYPEFTMPKHGDLTAWAQQGVLLLNMALTIPAGAEPKAHLGVWKPFLVKTVREILELLPDTIFVLWGSDAQRIKGLLGNATVLISGHPSPMAVNMGGNFIGNGHFKAINAALVALGEEPIDWQV